MISGISSSSSFGSSWQVQQSGTRSSTEDLFSKIDADGDGSVSKSEFNDFQKEMQARFEQSVVSSQFATQDSSSTEEVFARIDANGDGSVTESEFSDFQTEMKENMQAMGPPPPPPAGSLTQASSIENLFNDIDEDSDGSVTKSEFENFLEEMKTQKDETTTQDSSSTEEVFARIDASGDGSVTESEFSDFQTEMKENMQAMGPPPPPPQSTGSSATGADNSVASMLKQAVNQYTRNAQDSESANIYGSAVNAYE